MGLVENLTRNVWDFQSRLEVRGRQPCLFRINKLYSSFCIWSWDCHNSESRVSFLGIWGSRVFRVFPIFLTALSSRIAIGGTKTPNEGLLVPYFSNS